MDITSFWIIGLWGIIGSGLSLSSRASLDPLLTGAFSLIMWIMFTFAAYSVQVSVGGGLPVTHSYTALALLGILGSVIMFLGLLENAFDFSFIDELDNMIGGN